MTFLRSILIKIFGGGPQTSRLPQCKYPPRSRGSLPSVKPRSATAFHLVSPIPSRVLLCVAFPSPQSPWSIWVGLWVLNYKIVTIMTFFTGYVWTLVFSTSQHGFSLNSMYRKMTRIESPILMVIQDTEQNVSHILTNQRTKYFLCWLSKWAESLFKINVHQNSWLKIHPI